jgi:hypothetical protein
VGICHAVCPIHQGVLFWYVEVNRGLQGVVSESDEHFASLLHVRNAVWCAFERLFNAVRFPPPRHLIFSLRNKLSDFDFVRIASNALGNSDRLNLVRCPTLDVGDHHLVPSSGPSWPRAVGMIKEYCVRDLITPAGHVQDLFSATRLAASIWVHRVRNTLQT